MAERLTNLELAAIQQRAERATPGFATGAWHGYPGVYVTSPSAKICSLVVTQDTRQDNPNAANDAEFIAHARRDIPRLLAEIRRLRGDADE